MAENSSNNETTPPNEGASAEAPKETLAGLLDQMSNPPVEDGGQQGDESQGEQHGGGAEGEDGLENAEGQEQAGEEEHGEGDDEGWVGDDSQGEGDEDGGSQSKQGSRNFRGRWDHLSDDERRVVELTTKRGLRLEEAYRVVYGEGGRSSDSAGDQEQVEEGNSSGAAGHLAAADEAVATAQRELDELEAQLDEDDSFDADPARRREIQRDLRKKTVALAELKAEQKLLKREAEAAERGQESERANRFNQGYETATNEAVRLFPDLTVEDSPLREAIQEEIQYLAATKSPLLNQPDYPLTVARRMARTLGIKPAGEAGPKAAKPQSPQNGTPAVVKSTGANKPGTRGIRPLPAGGSPVEPPSLEERAAGAKSTAELLEIMREHGTPVSELARR